MERKTQIEQSSCVKCNPNATHLAVTLDLAKHCVPLDFDFRPAGPFLLVPVLAEAGLRLGLSAGTRMTSADSETSGRLDTSGRCAGRRDRSKVRTGEIGAKRGCVEEASGNTRPTSSMCLTRSGRLSLLLPEKTTVEARIAARSTPSGSGAGGAGGAGGADRVGGAGSRVWGAGVVGREVGLTVRAASVATMRSSCDSNAALSSSCLIERAWSPASRWIGSGDEWSPIGEDGGIMGGDDGGIDVAGLGGAEIGLLIGENSASGGSSTAGKAMSTLHP